MNYNSSPLLTDCDFNGNEARFGGGMYNYNKSLTITNCTFRNNEATLTGDGEANGGGLYNSDCNVTFTDCTFRSNTAASNGGGMYNSGTINRPVKVTFIGTDNIFNSNRSSTSIPNSGAAIHNDNGNSYVTITGKPIFGTGNTNRNSPRNTNY